MAASERNHRQQAANCGQATFQIVRREAAALSRAGADVFVPRSPVLLESALLQWIVHR
jgi:hypothetical protein